MAIKRAYKTLNITARRLCSRVRPSHIASAYDASLGEHLSRTRIELVTLCVLSTRDNQLHQRDA